MSQTRLRISSYRKHKASGKAVVTLDGRDCYLGPHSSQISRDEFLNTELFADLRDAQALSARWRNDYNHRWPHSSLGYLPPATDAARLATQSDGGSIADDDEQNIHGSVGSKHPVEPEQNCMKMKTKSGKTLIVAGT